MGRLGSDVRIESEEDGVETELTTSSDPPASGAVAPSPLPMPGELSPASPARAQRWSVGTLTYTAGGLAILFFWLLWGDFTISLKDRSVTPTLQVLLRTYH